MKRQKKNVYKVIIWDYTDPFGYYGERRFDSKEQLIAYMNRNAHKNPNYSFCPCVRLVGFENLGDEMATQYELDNLFTEKGWRKD